MVRDAHRVGLREPHAHGAGGTGSTQPGRAVRRRGVVTHPEFWGQTPHRVSARGSGDCGSFCQVVRGRLSTQRCRPFLLHARRERAPCARVLTGAGISTESGHPRLPVRPRHLGRVRPARGRAHQRVSPRPGRVWAFYRLRIDVVRQAAPNAGHVALAQLERDGRLARVITQNVDGLHRAAGSDALEVHGALDRVDCLDCGAQLPIAEAERRMAGDAEGVPRCDCGAPLKPGVVLFGEMLPEARSTRRSGWRRPCDLLIAAGSTLEVHPVAGLPEVARRAGATLAIVNRGPTAYDDAAICASRARRRRPPATRVRPCGYAARLRSAAAALLVAGCGDSGSTRRRRLRRRPRPPTPPGGRGAARPASTARTGSRPSAVAATRPPARPGDKRATTRARPRRSSTSRSRPWRAGAARLRRASGRALRPKSVYGTRQVLLAVGERVDAALPADLVPRAPAGQAERDHGLGAGARPGIGPYGHADPVDLSARRLDLYRLGSRVLRVPTRDRPHRDADADRAFYVDVRYHLTDPGGRTGRACSGSPPTPRPTRAGRPATRSRSTAQRAEPDRHAASNGCIRVHNADITRIMKLAPTGTPVEIRA